MTHDEVPLAVWVMGAMVFLLALRGSGSQGSNVMQIALPWVVLSLSAVTAVAFERGWLSIDGLWTDGTGKRSKNEKGNGDGEDLMASMARGENPQKNWPPQELMPDLYDVSRPAGAHAWLRSDPELSAGLRRALAPYRFHETHRVARVITLLGEFYRRYDRLFRAAATLHVSHHYSVLVDLQLAVLNGIQELHLSMPHPLNGRLTRLATLVQSRTSRLLSVIRHKYPAELRAESRGLSGPSAHDPAAPPTVLYA